MHIAFLILTHNTPSHTRRLVEALSSNCSDIFIHVDAKSNFLQFAALEEVGVQFTSRRVAVHWGEYSQVEAILLLLRKALANNVAYDYVVLLSGSDYPLVSVRNLERFFELAHGAQFINSTPIPNEAAGKPLSRLTQYVPRSDRFGQRLLKAPCRVGRRLRLSLLQRDYRAYVGDLQPYGGSTWWALTGTACKYIVDFIERNEKALHFLENTANPDETLFQTIIGNSEFGSDVRHNLTYTDWNKGGSSPATLTLAHVEALVARRPVICSDIFGVGEMLFARKFPDDSGHLITPLLAALDGPAVDPGMSLDMRL